MNHTITHRQELKRNLSMFTMAQRHALALKKEDIIYNFIYQVSKSYVHCSEKLDRFKFLNIFLSFYKMV